MNNITTNTTKTEIKIVDVSLFVGFVFISLILIGLATFYLMKCSKRKTLL